MTTSKLADVRYVEELTDVDALNTALGSEGGVLLYFGEDRTTKAWYALVGFPDEPETDGLDAEVEDEAVPASSEPESNFSSATT